MKHVLAVSGGKDSTALALRMQEVEPRDYDYLITPVGNELDEMNAHWEKLETLLGKKFIRLKPFGEVDGLKHLIEFYSALPNWRQRWCTRQLKIEPTIAFLAANAPAVQYVGLRADEPASERGGIYGEIPGVTQRYPLREWGWGEEDVWRYLAGRGISIPKRTDCAWCFGQKIIEWKRLWEEHPDVFQQGVDLERQTGHTFRSKNRDTWPAGLEDLRAEFERGRVVRGEAKQKFRTLEMYEAGEPEHQTCRMCRL